MNQLFYNIAGGVVQIQSKKQTTISEVIVSGEMLSKIGVGFTSNFLLKARVLFYSPVCHFMICLVLPEHLSVMNL